MVGNKILVALDRSPQASVVFAEALGLSRAPNSTMAIFHCLDWESESLAEVFLGIGTLGDVDLYGTALGQRRTFLERKVRQAQEWLQVYYQQAQEVGISCELKCQAGDPGTRICEFARVWGANIIVLGRRGHRGISEALLGSVSSYVVHHASCSVLISQTEE
jgi:nucleotide-binding universal stress UspA family protein